ncbi:MAG TPA: DUF4430 domain-containing protein [Oscillospiraceae bacterium]|nr:DUF4430 domain-containing protein [Oscillospiraceae bacterium]HPF55199.1 DUF4430 domain-containing protein [Clostridiales bacterium]HPK36417.1 DUF4430 domain-containing protein [Oscillospiraceae bacterium]HPR75721.1 DUF4430 domain-containing protein [Oscillospiraceae bacterium]
MKSKFFAVFACCLLILASFSGVAALSAQDANNTVDEVLNLADGIVAYNESVSNAASIQEWINTELAEGAGQTSEWYVMALSQSGETYDFSEYTNALIIYLDENEISGAVSRQKYALALIAAGCADDPYVTAIAEESIGQQGIMSFIFGLHLLNNGCINSSYTTDAVIGEILSLRLTDGGWALTGTVSDVDVTAMAIQALAPYYQTNETVKTAVDEAITFLSEIQLDGGDYSSYGVENPESAAQVAIALSSLGINCMSDSRFIKNENTLFDGMAKYLLSDGSFSHIAGGDYNRIATAQIFIALYAYQRQQANLGSFFIFDTPAVSNGNGQETAAQTRGYQFWVSISAAGIALAVCVVLIITKKTHFKNFLAVILAAAAVIAFIQLTDFSKASDYYNGETVQKGEIIGTVTLIIRCDTIIGKSDSEYIPADGVILNTAAFDIADGDTVYDILVEAARKYDIQIENSGTSDLVYIAGINYLYEFQFGDLSGWVFRVNGDVPSVGCGEFVLSDGDVIEWLYSCELGNDLG